MKAKHLFFQIGRTLLLFVLFSLLVKLQACGDDDHTNPLQVRLNELTGTWRLGTVFNDNNDITNQFQGFELTFEADKTFITQNGGNAWPASGRFDFLDDNANLIVRNDDVEVEIVEITNTSLQLSFTQSTLNGRAAGITGSFSFSLIK